MGKGRFINLRWFQISLDENQTSRLGAGFALRLMRKTCTINPMPAQKIRGHENLIKKSECHKFAVMKAFHHPEGMKKHLSLGHSGRCLDALAGLETCESVQIRDYIDIR